MILLVSENNTKIEKSSKLQSALLAFDQNIICAPSTQGLRKQSLAKSIKNQKS